MIGPRNQRRATTSNLVGVVPDRAVPGAGQRVSVRRTYTKRQKVTAVVAAELSTQTAAAGTTGIPLTTINAWMQEPWAVELRNKTREDLAEESRVLAHKVLAQIAKRLDDFGPRDLPILYGVLVDKGQLLAGQPTGRTEHLVTEGMDDHEKEALREFLRKAIAERSS